MSLGHHVNVCYCCQILTKLETLIYFCITFSVKFNECPFICSQLVACIHAFLTGNGLVAASVLT
jgi:hypothetical protein